MSTTNEVLRAMSRRALLTMINSQNEKLTEARLIASTYKDQVVRANHELAVLRRALEVVNPAIATELNEVVAEEMEKLYEE